MKAGMALCCRHAEGKSRFGLKLTLRIRPINILRLPFFTRKTILLPLCPLVMFAWGLFAVMFPWVLAQCCYLLVLAEVQLQKGFKKKVVYRLLNVKDSSNKYFETSFLHEKNDTTPSVPLMVIHLVFCMIFFI